MKIRKRVYVLFVCILIAIGVYRHVNQNVHTLLHSKEEVMELLKESTWRYLNYEEKLGILESVKELECDYLGINYDLSIETKDLNGTVVGTYEHNRLCITIDEHYLDTRSSKDVVKTLCHEIHHAYQYCLIEAYESLDECDQELLLFESIRYYKKELENYKSSSNGDEYYNQLVEVTSREYASDAVKKYIKEGE